MARIRIALGVTGLLTAALSAILFWGRPSLVSFLALSLAAALILLTDR